MIHLLCKYDVCVTLRRNGEMFASKHQQSGIIHKANIIGKAYTLFHRQKSFKKTVFIHGDNYGLFWWRRV